MNIITHRGLSPSRKNYFLESSLEAFEDQIKNGFGLEFDIQITKDKKIIVSHDSDLKRISDGQNDRKFKELTQKEILSKEFKGCHLTALDKLLEIIDKKQKTGTISAIHLKHSFQNKDNLDTFLSYLEKIDVNKFIIFDVTLETAKYLKEKNNRLHLAPSVAHLYDIERYNNCVGGTLMSLETALLHKDLFDWVWLDEWDRADQNGTKKLYTDEVFKKIRENKMKIALVTPELHASSPCLLGSEKHSDAFDEKTLFARINEIIKLKPDIICTDYADEVKKLQNGENRKYS